MLTSAEVEDFSMLVYRLERSVSVGIALGNMAVQWQRHVTTHVLGLEPIPV